MKKWLVPLIACTLLITPLLPAASASAAPYPYEVQTLTIKEIIRHSDPLVKIYALDSEGEELGTGSGFVITADGQIVTNYHVIEDAVKLKIEFANKQTYETNQTLLVDANRDLALIKINATGLPFVTLGDSAKLELGDPVVAIGSPLGFENTITNGLISGIRHFEDEDLDYLQTSAPVTSGSSGGALFNVSGEVIGVTTLSSVFMRGEVNFAIPSNDVKKFLTQPHQPKNLTEAITDAEEDPERELDEYDVMLKIDDALSEKLPTYQHPLTGEKADLSFYTDFDFDYTTETEEEEEEEEEVADILTIEMDLDSTPLYNYLLGDLNGPNSKRTADLLGQVLKIAHDAGGKNLTVTFYYNSTTRKLDKNFFIGDSFYFSPGTGSYHVSHIFAWAKLDDKTGQMTYLIHPGQNDVEQQTKLFTP